MRIEKEEFVQNENRSIMKKYLPVLLVFFYCSLPCLSQTLIPHHVPDEFVSDQYAVEINGISAPVFQVSPRVHFVSFDFTGKVDIQVKGEVNREIGVHLPIREEQLDGQSAWEGDAVIRPLSRNIKVVTENKKASFTIDRPGQYSLEGRNLTQFAVDNQDMVLFVFANNPETNRPQEGAPNLRYLKPGVHQENIDLKSEETLYLEAGAVLFGSIDVYDAKDVKILGRGVVLHYGPQSENHDDGYLRKENWHPLTTRNSERLTVEGVTFIARSRTWTIQMHSTYDADFDNVKVLGINDQNINGDGFDWVAGGGRTTITNSLIRSADDAFAIFTPRDSVPEGTVKDIHIENCVIWPTRANILRASGYTDGFTMANCDIIHVPASLFGVPRSLICSINQLPRQATLSNFLFKNLRFEEPAALLGLDFEGGEFNNIVFRNITMQGEPLPLYIDTNINGLLFENVVLNGQKILEKEDLTFKRLTKGIKNLKFSE